MRPALFIVFATVFWVASLTLYATPGAFLATIVIVLIVVARACRRSLVRWGLWTTAGSVLWFLCVHVSYDVALCARCDYRVTRRVDWEILRVPLVSATTPNDTLFTLAAGDLGCPCPQTKLIQGARIYDYWGRIYLDPRDRGYTYGMTFPGDLPPWFPDDYRRRFQSKVLKHRREHPEVAVDFCKHAITEGDTDYGYKIIYEDIFGEPVPESE